MSGTCGDCGMALEDPAHRVGGGWHKLLTWNAAIFELAAERQDAEFEQRLADHDRRHGRGRDDRQGGLGLEGEARGRMADPG